MASSLPLGKRAPAPRRRRRLRAHLTPRRVRVAGALCLAAGLFVATRPFWASPRRGEHPPRSLVFPLAKPPPLDVHEEAIGIMGRDPQRGFPPEPHPPDPALYGSARERCFALGVPDGARGDPPPAGHAARFWRMNSRALCSMPGPVCLSGPHLEHVTTFEPRGSGACSVVAVDGTHTAMKSLAPAERAGLNESCAAFRNRHVISMFGNESFADWGEWLRDLQSKQYSNRRRHPAKWESDFAIIVPKYEWSWNICHYSRIWNFVLFVVRNLHLFVPKRDRISSVSILFRSGLPYNGAWPSGLRTTTLPFLSSETGLKITVGKIRHDGYQDFQCIKSGILLGGEGRVDAFPFLNDSAVWTPRNQELDNHWPVIPHESLWLRQAVLSSYGLGNAGVFTGPGFATFNSIPVPPLHIAYLVRSPRSKRRLTPLGTDWFTRSLTELCEKYGFKQSVVRFRKEMDMREQVEKIYDKGMAVGLHGANMVNTMFMPAGGALFEIFPWRYVRFYYAAGANSGLRYSFHEAQNGQDQRCSFMDKGCFMKYRESVVYLSMSDRDAIYERIENAMRYLVQLHQRYPSGQIPLVKTGNVYRIAR